MNKSDLSHFVTGKTFAITLLAQLLSNPAFAEGNADRIWKTLTDGKFDFSAEWRYEHVDDNTATEQAEASLFRTTLGYTSGQFFNFNGRLQVQDVRAVGLDDYNDATGRPNAKTGFAVIADPADTDFIEGYIGFNGIPDTTIRAGRQLITYRDAPFHRFMGTILWRRNWQNHDAITLTNTSLADTTINYAYSWNINRIFTEKAVASAAANFDSNSHFINIQYAGFSLAKLETYGYLLDFGNAPGFSTNTFGGRLNGGYPMTDNIKAIYAAEYARQYDAANHPEDFSADYILGELGGSFSFSGPIKSVTVKFSYEQLEGDGANAFNTILGTNHAYQGWADRFLITPVNGIEDYYVTAIIKVLDTTFVASWHDLNSDNLGFDYGTEIDLLATRTFMERYTVGLKYACYDADINVNNPAGALASDTSKFWAWVGINF